MTPTSPDLYALIIRLVAAQNGRFYQLNHKIDLPTRICFGVESEQDMARKASFCSKRKCSS